MCLLIAIFNILLFSSKLIEIQNFYPYKVGISDFLNLNSDKLHYIDSINVVQNSQIHEVKLSKNVPKPNNSEQYKSNNDNDLFSIINSKPNNPKPEQNSYKETSSSSTKTQGKNVNLEPKYFNKYKFMSIKATPATLRAGPGPSYKAEYLFTKRFEPVLLLGEKGDWIKIQDYYGDSGWIHRNLLSKTQYIVVLKKANMSRWIDNKLIAVIHPMVKCKVLSKKEKTKLEYIYVECNKIKGYIKNSNLWGND